MPSTSATIDASVKAFAKDITAFLDKKREAKIKKMQDEAKKKKQDTKEDFGAKLVIAKFDYSTRSITQNRTPQVQAKLISDKASWTCASAHMIDMARHVDLKYGAPGKKAQVSWALSKAFGSGAEHFATLSEVKTKWNALMKTHSLKNYAGKDGWSNKDSFHFELAESKVPRNDPKVAACLEHYAKITRLEGAQRNTSFESGSWKSALAPYVKAAEKEAQAKAEAERKKEMAALRFKGTLSGQQNLMKNANKSGTAKGSSLGSILPKTKEDIGKPKRTKKTVGGAMVWDSLPRSFFENLGLSETKGFDVKLTGSLSYVLVEYPMLSQVFIEDVTPACGVIFNTPVAPLMKATVTSVSNLSLAEAKAGVNGTVTLNLTLKTPLDEDKGVITITFKDGKPTAKTKIG